MKLVKVVETCFACPSQWDAWTDEGKYLYMRFRSGHGTVRMYDDYSDSLAGGLMIAEFRHGHDMAGSIHLDKFCELAGLEIAEDADIKLCWPPDDFYDTLETLKGW